MITFSLGLILGIFIGAYVASPVFRRKINNKILKRENTKALSSSNICEACNGTGLQTLKSGLQVKCPVCSSAGVRK